MKPWTIPATAIAVIAMMAFSAIGWAQAPVTARVARVTPADALTQGKVRILRNGSPVKPDVSVIVETGDVVEVVDAQARLILRLTDGQEVVIDKKKSGNAGYRFDPRPMSVFDNVAKRLGIWDAHPSVAMAATRGKAVTAATRTECNKSPPIYMAANDGKGTFHLGAGERALHFRWSGACPPYRLVIAREGRTEIEQTTDATQITLPRRPWAPGVYSLELRSEPCVLASNECVWKEERLTFMTADKVPAMPPEIAHAALDEADRQVLYADWLARLDTGSWRLESLQQAAPWSANERVQKWLDGWGGQ